MSSILSWSNLASVIDILLVALILYWLMLMVRGTRAERMLWGLGVIVVVYFVSLRAELLTLHWVLSNFLGSIAIFIVVVFQQDIRKALVQMGRPFIYREKERSGDMLEEVASAAASMSGARTGCLIVIERSMDLGAFLDTGVEVDARVSKELLLCIFDASSPLHDGAAVVRGRRITKAGCILPLAEKELAEAFGTRKRAALGIAEETDAVSISVSEKTGEISLAFEDEFFTGLGPGELLGNLKELFPEERGPRKMTIFPWRARA